jgi:hypothetical protein
MSRYPISLNFRDRTVGTSYIGNTHEAFHDREDTVDVMDIFLEWAELRDASQPQIRDNLVHGRNQYCGRHKSQFTGRC